MRFAEEAQINSLQLQTVNKMQGNYVTHFIKMLDRFAVICAFCYVYDAAYSIKHNILACPKLKTGMPGLDEKAYNIWKQSIKYKKHPTIAICYMCHLPRLGTDLHPPFKHGGAG
ncbi:hypothetical protein H0H93_003015, partial [Arthromyces matolae]